MHEPAQGRVAFGLERYEDRGLIGRGAMGEVRRVYDRLLGVNVAMKTLKGSLADDDSARARFLSEATLTAGLRHPGIVAVHDRGEHEDGRLWYTMTEVQGRTLASLVQAAWQPGPPEPSELRRLLEVVQQACEAMAHAHQQGVIHRDLKPDNLMVGEFDEVRVMDWGLARRAGAEEPRTELGPATMRPGYATQDGQVLGTPAYMAPEQARGAISELGPFSDVYALGSVLYEVLTGTPPLTGPPMKIWRRMMLGPPPLFEGPLRLAVDPSLELLCRDALEWEAEHRLPHAGDLAERLGAWLRASRRRAEAEQMLDEAEELAPRIARLRALARERRKRARAVLEPLPPYAPSGDKEPGWALEDEAAELDRQAGVLQVSWRQQVGAALQRVPDLDAAHRMLADHHAAGLREAERAGDSSAVAREEALLAEHDRGWYAALREGTGAVSLVSDPPGAEVRLFRVVERARRRVLEPAGTLGNTPLEQVSLAAGSWVLELHHTGHHVVRYPVWIQRGEHWDGVRPGSSTSFPIALPRQGELAADDCYVPAGYFWSGGDPEAGEALPGRMVWVDGFVVKRDPVVVGEYLDFVQDLARTQGVEAALARVPRKGEGSAGGRRGQPLWTSLGGGRWDLGQDPTFVLSKPITLVSWRDSLACAAWRAARDGLAWRLPGSQEWEKAARGVDGRVVAWGQHLEPTWANVLGCRAESPSLVAVDEFPVDTSIFGLRGSAGNVRDRCADAWTLAGPELVDGIYRCSPVDPADGGYREVRGGSFHATPTMGRTAGRFVERPTQVWTSVGFRLARPL